MVIHKCDYCGKEMEVWLIITAKVGGRDFDMTSDSLSSLSGNREICKKCCDLPIREVLVEGFHRKKSIAEIINEMKEREKLRQSSLKV
ncbi:MAG: hypothetical protein IJS02_02785 [Bacteroidales bacterium]|nr:hypothetical protein [Bacteroidales bacterium]